MPISTDTSPRRGDDGAERGAGEKALREGGSMASAPPPPPPAAAARGRDDLEVGEPMSPAGRLFRETHFNCYIVAVIGLGTAVDIAAARAGLEATLVRHPRFSSVQVRPS